jgi:hypothetical protein
MTRRVTDLPVRQSKQPVRQQIAGWVERFAKSIAVVHNRIGIAFLRAASFGVAPLHAVAGRPMGVFKFGGVGW